ncbi:Gfo/Idh/MocA family protein [Sorangium sp. So ce1182]|uniref:Gfo/Idh/MocA family protein n=1 Tax=Sorangium sp. So ce1182 TaxID=3133334 RepID=UPI003F5D5EAD
MTGSSFRAGVIGTGFIGPVHVEALRRLGIEVLALAGNGAERTAAKARQLRVERVYGSAEEMMNDREIDVVHITSPNHLHHAHARAAMLAGKHVICEKPLAMNTQQSAELVELAAERGLVNAVNFNLRYYPLSQHARSLVQGGEVGDVHIIQGSYQQDWLLLPSDWNWRLDPELGGKMRAVSDIGSHWIDLTSFITGRRVVSVLADVQTFVPVRRRPKRPVETFTGKMQTRAEYVEQPVHTEDYASVLIRYEGRARGVMTVSQVSAGRKNRAFYEIDGARAAIAWNGESPNELWIGHRDKPNEVLFKDPALMSKEARRFSSYPGGHVEGFADTFKGLYGAVYGYLEQGEFSETPDFPTFADGHMSLRVDEAIWTSARESRWVDVSEVGP